MASGFVIYYSIWALFATHLQKDLGLSPAMIATPIAIANLVAFLASGFWGCGRRHHRPPLVDDHSGVHRHLRRADSIC